MITFAMVTWIRFSATTLHTWSASETELGAVSIERSSSLFWHSREDT